MSSELASILLYGVDPTLLQLRQSVLQKSGFQSDMVEQAAEFDHILQARMFALLILCHTLPPNEMRRAHALAAARRTTLPIISLVSSISRQLPSGNVVSTSPGPEVLIRAVRATLNPLAY